MKASVYLGPERVELRDIEEPKPGDDEVLIKVARAGLCGTDLHVYQGHMDQAGANSSGDGARDVR